MEERKGKHKQTREEEASFSGCCGGLYLRVSSPRIDINRFNRYKDGVDFSNERERSIVSKHSIDGTID